MRLILKLLLAACVLLPLSAAAQTVPVPGGTVLTNPARFSTYYAAYTGITTASALTDFFVIGGSATKTIYVKRVACSGVSTADGTSLISAIKRSTADTGGTAITPSASAGGQKVPLDSGNSAATATAVAYSANPTLGTAVGVVRTATIATAVAATSGAGRLTVFEFGNNVDQHLVLRGTAQQLAIGGLGTALVAGAVLSCEAEWLEQ